VTPRFKPLREAINKDFRIVKIARVDESFESWLFCLGISA
jgi:hypothetical protein